jgi:hypothetical protein
VVLPVTRSHWLSRLLEEFSLLAQNISKDIGKKILKKGGCVWSNCNDLLAHSEMEE